MNEILEKHLVSLLFIIVHNKPEKNTGMQEQDVNLAPVIFKVSYFESFQKTLKIIPK